MASGSHQCMAICHLFIHRIYKVFKDSIEKILSATECPFALLLKKYEPPYRLGWI